MGETRREQTTNPGNPSTTEATREQTTSRTPSTPTPEVTRESTSESSSSGGQKCEVLRDSCKENAKFKATFPTGNSTFCCEEHKQTLVENYPEYQLEFEEV
jgi:hypothetical protein